MSRQASACSTSNGGDHDIGRAGQFGVGAGEPRSRLFRPLPDFFTQPRGIGIDVERRYSTETGVAQSPGNVETRLAKSNKADSWLAHSNRLLNETAGKGIGFSYPRAACANALEQFAGEEPHTVLHQTAGKGHAFSSRPLHSDPTGQARPIPMELLTWSW